eukprot:TRINITY_DN4935_c0_g3_i1.p1 TRINITY_DN4935_c0_g3~~TRINITY_DN4935_c0_g3_i1.p1  ORF type:complete len:287 (+),score=91.52 TRINITY_DN4935_c0_g3_i1:212-1072(+)
MYMFCCWTRPAPQPQDDAPRRSSNSRSPTRFGAGSRPIATGEGAKGTDAEKFDIAVEKNDLASMVALLDSSQSIQCSEQMHPWAENPRTVGALAGTRLAMLAQGSQKEAIREANAIPKLVKFLKSSDTDRMQTAVVALSFLTTDCPKNAMVAYEAGAMPLLLKNMDAEVAGMRAAAATTLRNICMENDEYRRKFVELGGLDGLVRQLGSTPDNTPNHADVQLEAVLNLQDMIEAEDGSLLRECAEMVMKAGAEEKLRRLLDTDDEELRSSVEEVMDSLAKVKHTTM